MTKAYSGKKEYFLIANFKLKWKLSFFKLQRQVEVTKIKLK